MKRKSLLLMTLLAMLLAPFAANAQSTYSWGSTSDNDGSSQYANPFGRYYGWEYRVFLYPANTMNFNGRITQLEFLADDELAAGGELDIWMKETTLTDLDADVTFAQYQANATLVYHSASSPAFYQDTYVAIPLQTPFMHDQSKNILILVRSVANGATGDGQYSFYKKNPGSSGYLTWLGCNDSEAPDPSDNGSFDYIDVTNEDLPVIRWTYGSTPSGCDFYEDFEGITGASGAYNTGGTLPDGWHRIYGGTSATGGTVYDHTATTPANMPHVHNNSSTPGQPSSGYYLGFYSNSSNVYSYAIMPPFANQMAPSHISFKYKLESSGQGALRYGVITGTDASTFVQIGSDITGSSGTISVDLNTSQTLGKRICFLWYKSGTWYTCGIDDICVELTRVESVPSNLAASNITPNSADITWNGDSDSYTVWANTRTETQTLLSQGFEGGSLPSGWTTTSTGSNNWSVMTSVCSGVSPHGGSYAAGTPSGTSSRSEEMYLITPAMNMTDAITATLHFFYYQKAWGSDVCPFGVYYRIGTSGTWQELFYSTTGTSAWTEKTINLPEAACTTNCQIGFYRKDNYGYGAAIDDVTVSALMPVAEEITVVAPPTTLTGLHPNTTYTVKVKGENTAYCTPITFTTAQCTLTLASSPAAAGTATAEPVGPFNEGDEVTLTATPAEGYMFKNWTKTGTGATFSNASDNPTTLTIGTANVTATANFVRAIQAGTQQSTSSYYPSQMNYRYSLTQQIYYPEEIGHTGTINCISFYCTSNSTQTRNIEIYLSKEGPASFDNSNKAFWKQMGTKVFDGTYTFKQGWNTIPLSTTFSYDNIDRNLMLTVYDKSGDYNGSLSFATFSHSNYCAQYKYSDDTEVGPTYLTTLPTPASVGKYKNIVRFGMTDSSVKNCYTVTAVANPTSAGHIEEMLIGTGTSTSNTIPFSTASNYSFTEQIYYAGSMGGAGTINSISFYLGSSSSSAQTNDIVVYMKNVRRGGFKDGTDYEPVTSSNIVYNGQWTIPASYTGWVTIDLSTPFTYDGTSNLLIAIDENTSGNSGRSFRYTSVSNTVYRAYGSDDVDPTALDSYSGTKAVSSYCPNIKLGIAYNNSGSSRMYANGASCTLNAEAVAPTASNFYVMAGWSENNETLSHAIPYTFTVNADHNLVASFEEWNVTLASTPDPTECLEQGTDVTMVASTNLPMTGDYMFTATTATFSSISSSPDGSTTSTGDGTTMDVTLPFDFNLAGKDFAAGTILKMRCDGFVAFGSAWSTHTPSGPGTTHDVISAFGYDQYLASSSAMYYKVTGNEGARVLTMEWKNMRSYSTTYNYANYQVKLYEGSNVVELCYGDYTYGKTVTVYIYVSANGKLTQLSSITEPAVTTNVAGTTTGISVSSAATAPASGTVYRFSAPVTYTWTANGTTGTASDNVYTVTPTQNSTYTVTATHANGCIKTANISVTFAPAAPTNLQVSNIGVTTATATWDANGESNWEYSYDGSNWGTIHTNSVDLVDLTPGTTYTFQVRSYSGDCDSETVSVEFTTESTHTVSVTAGIGGNASGSGTYNHGASCTVTATPSTENGYHFVNWTENGTEVSTEASYTFTVLADRDLVANFALDTHTVTISANPTEGGTVSQSGSGTYNYSDGCIVTASPATGWTFVNWTEDGSEVSTEASYTFTVHGNRTLVANFVYTFTKDITGHQGGKGNWYLISSPLDGTIAPTAVVNMIPEQDGQPNVDSQDYDLFSFKQDAPVDPETGLGLEWINYKETAENGGGFTLEAGKGYLYANYNTVQLQFTGVPYQDNGAGCVSVYLTHTTGFNWSDWNLVGNPYNGNAYLDGPFYKMNPEGTEIVAVENSDLDAVIGPMEGVFVKYDADEVYIAATFSRTSGAKGASLALNVTKDRGLVDRAFVSFGGKRSLDKLQLNASHSKIYIPKGDKDYAIVVAESDMGELPVNFKAEKNGSYTISVNAMDVAFGYLHLIDNKTGADIDLLATPSYSFESLTTDYASRFKLVFATADSDDDNFGFYNGSAWVISNDGEAVLQVVDVTGRILKSESISGCVSVNFNAAAGVYMLRLVNGDNVKVQKVVVR